MGLNHAESMDRIDCLQSDWINRSKVIKSANEICDSMRKQVAIQKIPDNKVLENYYLIDEKKGLWYNKENIKGRGKVW